MDEEEKVRLEVAQGVQVEPSEDGKLVALFFKTRSGPKGVALAGQELSRLASLLIKTSQQVAASNTPDTPASEVTATPIDVSYFGVAKGRSDTEAILSLVVGNLTMTYAVELSTLLSALRTLEQITAVETKRTLPH